MALVNGWHLIRKAFELVVLSRNNKRSALLIRNSLEKEVAHFFLKRDNCSFVRIYLYYSLFI